MLYKYLRKKERGIALPMTIICLALGSIAIATSIAYADTMLRSTYVRDERNEAFYAADSGVEDALWCIKNAVPTRVTLPQNINGYQVTMNTVYRGNFCIIAGEFVDMSGHCDWMHISETIQEDPPSSNNYKYTITITRDPSCSGNIKLQEVGARIPPGYTYQHCNVVGNLSRTPPKPPPSITYDGQNAQIIRWIFDPPRPQLDEANPTAFQAFYFTGTAEFSGYYSWVIAERTDIGPISMIQGDVYIITAQAISPLDGKVRGTVICDVMLTLTNELYVIRWRITP